MHEFISTAVEARHQIPIDWQDPSEQLMAAEEHEPDDGNIDARGLGKVPGDAILILLRFLIGSQPGKQRWRTAQLRLAVLARAAGLDGIGGLSLEALGAELDCTRANLSLYSVRLIDQLGIAQTRGGKRRATRDTYRQAAIRSHKARGHKMTGPQWGNPPPM